MAQTQPRQALSLVHFEADALEKRDPKRSAIYDSISGRAIIDLGKTHAQHRSVGGHRAQPLAAYGYGAG
jgi:hypothetical protein